MLKEVLHFHEVGVMDDLLFTNREGRLLAWLMDDEASRPGGVIHVAC